MNNEHQLLRLKVSGFIEGELTAKWDMNAPDISHEAWGRVGEALAAAFRREGIPHRVEAAKGSRLCAVEARDLWPPAAYDEARGELTPAEKTLITFDPTSLALLEKLGELLAACRLPTMDSQGRIIVAPTAKRKAARRGAKR